MVRHWYDIHTKFNENRLIGLKVARETGPRTHNSYTSIPFLIKMSDIIYTRHYAALQLTSLKNFAKSRGL
jgi:hypothetical protein